MPEQSLSLRALRIGDWHVDPATGLLSRQGTVRRLRLQVIDVLLALASRPSEVVSKQELLDSAWKGRFVSDSPLTTTIAELREALEGDAKEPRYIQTAPKRGYRLIATVRDAAPDAAPPASPAMPAAVAGALPSQALQPPHPLQSAPGGPPVTSSCSRPLPPRSRCSSR